MVNTVSLAAMQHTVHLDGKAGLARYELKGEWRVAQQMFNTHHLLY